MKTYKQFNHDMQENILKDNPVINNRVTRFLGKSYNKIQPLKNLLRFDNIKKLKNNPNMSLVDKASTIAGVIRPYSLPAYAKDIYQSGKTDSVFDKGVRLAGRLNNKVPFLPKSTTKDFNPNKDLGKIIGDKLNNIFRPNRRFQNMGASDLKKTPGMG
tara:strand:+ start:1252 stop:1725 length:474 start_codon:yes stop_codon:yes gene_type:complete